MPLPAVSVKVGATWSGLDAVRTRLRAFGDLAPGDGGSGPAYDAATAAAVSRFQARHGLEPDGVLGRRTAAALQVSPGQRAAQIELALERLRWVPDLGTRRVIAVNIPMFQLATWEAGRLREPPARVMKVIVGEAVRTETPVFLETLSHVIFRPYWNVPASIVHNEVLPALRRNPRYLERQHMELVRGPGDDAPIVPADAAGLAALAQDAVRLRQRPGPANALGLVKFVFPNRDSVYMHGTPTPALFARDRRDFSHGCIRVEDPAGLAAWVLDGVSGWTPERIADAMQGADNTRVDVAAPIDVVLFYLTAAADPAGAVRFADDIYGHDRALAAALSALRRR
ncbi:MAG: L,D-transpeptidase family protein [Vicinamibacterales bacterium]